MLKALVAKEESELWKRVAGSSSAPAFAEEALGRARGPRRVRELENEHKPRSIKKSGSWTSSSSSRWTGYHAGVVCSPGLGVTSQKFRRFMPDFLLDFYEKCMPFQRTCSRAGLASEAALKRTASNMSLGGRFKRSFGISGECRVGLKVQSTNMLFRRSFSS